MQRTPLRAAADAERYSASCDNCPASYNPAQTDTDGDSIGDVCDNCPTVRNETQHDLNSNGVGDECDFADGVLFFTRITKNRVNWQSDLKYTTYNLYRGSLAVLTAGGPYSQVPGSNPYSAHYCALTANSQAETLVPAAGEALYWLVTGRWGGGEEALGDGDTVVRNNANPCP